MPSHLRSVRFWERAAFLGALGLAAWVVAGTLFASPQPIGAEAEDPVVDEAVISLGAFGEGVTWSVEGLAWRPELALADDATLEAVLAAPMTAELDPALEGRWTALGTTLRRRLPVLGETRDAIAYGSRRDGSAFAACYRKRAGEPPSLVGVRLGERREDGQWAVSTARVGVPASAVAAPLPLLPGDRVTASGTDSSGAVVAAMVETATPVAELIEHWSEHGWRLAAGSLAGDGARTVAMRGVERVQVTRIGGRRVALVRLTNRRNS